MGGRSSLEKLVAYYCKVKENNNGNKAFGNLIRGIHS